MKFYNREDELKILKEADGLWKRIADYFLFNLLPYEKNL